MTEEASNIKAGPAIVHGVGQIIRKGTGEVVDFTFTGTVPADPPQEIPADKEAD